MGGLSSKKHNTTKRLKSHCVKNDKTCLDEQYNASQVYIAKVDGFYDQCFKRWSEENDLDSLLLEMGVPVIFISYDILCYPSSTSEGAKEWNKALEFVGGQYKSWDQIQNAMQIESTTKSRNHKDLISNWMEVQERFSGTPLETFLRLD